LKIRLFPGQRPAEVDPEELQAYLIRNEAKTETLKDLFGIAPNPTHFALFQNNN